MKRIARIGICFLLAACLFGTVACGKTLKPNGNGYYCSATGVTYMHVSDNWVNAAVPNTEQAYATLEISTLKLALYEVPGQAAENFLLTEDGILLARVGTVLPEVDSAVSVSVCASGAQTVALSTVTDVATVGAVTDLLGVGVSLPETPVSPVESYRLRFAFENLEGVVYELSLLCYENGYLVYDGLDAEETQAVEAQLRDTPDAEPVLPEGYVLLTTDARVNVSLQKLELDGGSYEWNVIYDYGNNVIYDRATRTYFATWDLLTPYVQGIETQETV